jgi:hypothetical protein
LRFCVGSSQTWWSCGSHCRWSRGNVDGTSDLAKNVVSIKMTRENTAEDLPEERAAVSNVVETFTIRFPVTQGQTCVDVGYVHCSSDRSADVLL